MFELPEVTTLAAQMNATLTGKTIRDGALGNSPHKFVWYNRNHDEFAALTAGKTVGRTAARGRWLLTAIEPGYRLVLGECGGRILYHADATTLPAKFHLHLHFDDDTHLTAMTQMWGAMELYAAGEEQERVYIKDMRPTPVDAAFSLAYFNGLVDTMLAAGKRSVKGLLTQDQLIPGLGNAIAQDIMFRARLQPRHALDTLTPTQRQALYEAIVDTVQSAIVQGGRNDEVDLYGQPGRYVRQMHSAAVERPCPACGAPIQKMQYLGGACYYCPRCQL